MIIVKKHKKLTRNNSFWKIKLKTFYTFEHLFDNFECFYLHFLSFLRNYLVYLIFYIFNFINLITIFRLNVKINITKKRPYITLNDNKNYFSIPK